MTLKYLVPFLLLFLTVTAFAQQAIEEDPAALQYVRVRVIPPFWVGGVCDPNYPVATAPTNYVDSVTTKLQITGAPLITSPQNFIFVGRPGASQHYAQVLLKVSRPAAGNINITSTYSNRYGESCTRCYTYTVPPSTNAGCTTLFATLSCGVFPPTIPQMYPPDGQGGVRTLPPYNTPQNEWVYFRGNAACLP